jgi:hypothetical protein
MLLRHPLVLAITLKVSGLAHASGKACLQASCQSGGGTWKKG